MAILHRKLQLFLLAIWIQSLFALALISCLPNIRIQVNNENLQNPPYLLEALKQVEKVGAANSESGPIVVATGGQPRQTSVRDLAAWAQEQQSRNRVTVPIEMAVISKLAANQSLSNKTPNGGGDDVPPATGDNSNNEENGETHNSFSVVKEETIEEILDLEPESVLKLSPESLINSVSPADYSRITDIVASDTVNHQEFSTNSENNKQNSELLVKKQDNNNNQPSNRKPNLPVTGSHIKKPATMLIDDVGTATGDSTVDSNNGTITQKVGGAKSLISPSVIVDEAPAAVNLEKKTIPNLPDTLEPSQIMNGVTNASLVPATVNREYGQQTRTRITLGGGFIRDRLPPLVNPSSGSYVDDRPEKPVKPLERPRLKEPTGPVEVSRVIEVPERIVLPASALKPAANEQLNNKVSEDINNNQSNQTIGHVDSRCPKEGITTIEHSTACDRYFYCEDGYISEQVCPNGLMYGTHDTIKDYCVHRWKAACDDKTIPNPISSPGCRWQYGIFSVQGSPKCSPDFYECTAGRFTVKKCSIDGQVYDDRTKSCRYAEQVGCTNEALADFHCPPDDQSNTYWPFPRYFFNERALIHCVNDKPEIVRCTGEERVDPEHLHCVPLAKLTALSGSGAQVERRARDRKKSSSR